MNVIFLGGTCGTNKWRDGFIERLVDLGVPREALFNPVVEHWNEAAQRREDEMKANPDVATLFYLGNPGEDGNQLSFYSLAEAIMGLYDHPERTAVVFDSRGMSPRAAKSSDKAFKDLKGRFSNAPIFDSLDKAENWVVRSFLYGE